MKKWYLLVTLLTFVGTWNWFPLLPAILVTHWGFLGEANGWMARSIGAWIIPILMILIWGLLEWAPHTDRITRDTKAFWAPYQVFGLGILLLLAGLQVAVIAVNLSVPVNMAKVMGWGLVVMSALMGRLLPTIPRNSVMGVRTPWSLANDRTWRITHEETGRCCRIVSLLGIIALILFSAPVGVGVVLISFIASLLWGGIFSYIYR